MSPADPPLPLEWDEINVAPVVAAKFSQKFEGTVEGPAKLGLAKVWRVWTVKSGEYHAHYAVGEDGQNLRVFRNFVPFALWLGDAFDREKLIAEAHAADERRRAWVRIIMASIIILVLLGLLVHQIVLKERTAGFSIGYVVTTLLGAGVAYLLGDWVKKK